MKTFRYLNLKSDLVVTITSVSTKRLFYETNPAILGNTDIKSGGLCYTNIILKKDYILNKHWVEE